MNGKFGLIGRTLKHSYSKKIHALLGKYPYDLYEIEPSGLENFVNSGELSGYNVTIPYKKDVIKYLDVVDKNALDIGAVNTVVIRDGKKYGYNTDFLGMKYMLARAGITLKDKTVMILGSGGTSNTARAVASDGGAKKIIIVSRSGEVNYTTCYEQSDVNVIINTTPVGMYPDNYSSPIDLSKIPRLEGVADVVYNPNTTAFTHDAKMMGIKSANGLPMLVAQAKYAMELFCDETVLDDVIEDIIAKLSKETLNVVLIGMAGCGKSTVGKLLAEMTGREFIDTDLEIEKRENRDIPTIFKDSGEAYFRAVEREVLKDVGKLTGKIISTGGGVVKDMENLFPLKSNGVIIWLKRDVNKLVTDNRPLSKDLETVQKLYAERKALYESFADFSVMNNGDIMDAVKGVMEKV